MGAKDLFAFEPEMVPDDAALGVLRIIAPVSTLNGERSSSISKNTYSLTEKFTRRVDVITYELEYPGSKVAPKNEVYVDLGFSPVIDANS